MTLKKRKKKQGFKSFWSRVRFKYKLTFINEDTLEEVWTFRLSQLSAFAVLLVFAFALVSVTAFIIIKTPIRNYLPGYLDVEVRKEIVQNALRADSLERMLEIQHVYLENVARIIGGEVPLDSIRKSPPPRNCAGWLQICLKWVNAPSTTPARRSSPASSRSRLIASTTRR